MPDMRPLQPGDPEQIGSYRLVGVLGSGGQGVVYRGVGDREVAIKVLHGHFSHDDDIAKGFLREVEAARRVAAFCTAAVLDVGMVDDRPYIVSEYVPGDTLQAVVRASGPREGGALDRLAISTLTALTAIHQAGIVHRDFKPGNVLMGPDGPIVIDFGIAKALDATTGTSVPVGTPTYMSPEQFEGERVGPASDVFSWAGTMVFAATGRTPFAGDTVAAIVNHVLSGVPDLSGVPPHLLGAIEACLSRDPAARPGAAELLQQLIRQVNPTGRPLAPPLAQAGHGSVADADTAPGRRGSIGRRALIGGGAAAAAVGVSAFALLRPGSGLLDPDGRRTGRPVGDTSSGSLAQSPGTASPNPAASAEPFGTQTGDPVPLPATDGAPTAMAAEGGTVVGTAKGAVFAWDLGPEVTRLGDGGGSAEWVCAGSLGGTPAVASGHHDGRMRLWRPAGGSLASRKVSDPVIAVTVTAGAAVAVSQKYDDMRDLHSVVRLWNISTGKQIGPAISDHFQGVRGLAFGRLGEDDVLVTGDGGERVRVWRLSDGKPLRSFRTGEVGGIELLACGEIDGRPVLVSTHLDATLRVYDLATGKRRKKWEFSDQAPDDRGATALVAGRIGDVPVAVVAHAPWNGDVIVRVWNLGDGDVIGVLGPGPGGAIRRLALAERDGRPMIAGAGEDRKLRIWSLGPA
ncbi:WD40 repeat domain-containing serine/threonine protein kinase [Nonomuraea sp. CA-141351]|uniref:WD40 repeat domain-containing serine/threonine protein kinase n=1 Tax=Nonomuraea sp. CA-141351 TaxID=3239996 RepID=UPI003D93D62E